MVFAQQLWLGCLLFIVVAVLLLDPATLSDCGITVKSHELHSMGDG